MDSWETIYNENDDTTISVFSKGLYVVVRWGIGDISLFRYGVMVKRQSFEDGDGFTLRDYKDYLLNVLKTSKIK